MAITNGRLQISNCNHVLNRSSQKLNYQKLVTRLIIVNIIHLFSDFRQHCYHCGAEAAFMSQKTHFQKSLADFPETPGIYNASVLEA